MSGGGLPLRVLAALLAADWRCGRPWQSTRTLPRALPISRLMESLMCSSTTMNLARWYDQDGSGTGRGQARRSTGSWQALREPRIRGGPWSGYHGVEEVVYLTATAVARGVAVVPATARPSCCAAAAASGRRSWSPSRRWTLRGHGLLVHAQGVDVLLPIVEETAQQVHGLGARGWAFRRAVSTGGGGPGGGWNADRRSATS